MKLLSETAKLAADVIKSFNKKVNSMIIAPLIQLENKPSPLLIEGISIRYTYIQFSNSIELKIMRRKSFDDNVIQLFEPDGSFSFKTFVCSIHINAILDEGAAYCCYHSLAACDFLDNDERDQIAIWFAQVVKSLSGGNTIGRRPEVSKLPGIHEKVKMPCEHYPNILLHELETVIIHMNDNHKWTRNQIADWLDTLDIDLYFKSPEVGEENDNEVG